MIQIIKGIFRTRFEVGITHDTTLIGTHCGVTCFVRNGSHNVFIEIQLYLVNAPSTTKFSIQVFHFCISIF